MKALNKAFDIMELFLDTGDGLAIAKMANLSRLNKSTVCRMATTMVVQRGYLKQHGKKGAFSLATKYLDFDGVIKNGLWVKDVPFHHLVELKNSLSESTNLAPWDKNEDALKYT